MGLSHYQRYTVTDHAMDRYRERFNANETNENITKIIIQWLSKADFLEKQKRGRQAWFNNEQKIIIVVDPSDFKVITLYGTMADHDSDDYIDKDYDVIEVHPTAEKIVSNLVKEKYRSIKTGYYEHLGQLYKEYGDRIDKLSRTTKPNMFKVKEREAKQLKREINLLEEECSNVTRSLKTYIIEGE